MDVLSLSLILMGIHENHYLRQCLYRSRSMDIVEVKMRKILVAGAVLLVLGLVATPYNCSFVVNSDLPRDATSSCINTYGRFLDDIITLNPSEPNGEHDWYVSPVEVTFHAKEGPGASGLKYIYYQINEGSWITHEIPGAYPNLPDEYDFSIIIDVDGWYVVSFKAEDWVGNVGPTHSVEFKIDMEPPTVSLITPQEGYIYMDMVDALCHEYILKM